MFFRKIHLQNFRSHIDTTLDLAPLTVIRGANAVGKSSIEMALQLVLAGRTDATTADGKGTSGLIRAGCAKAALTLAVNEGGEERVVKMVLNGPDKSRAVIKPDDPQYSGGSDYIDSLSMARETFSCLCNNRYFVDMKQDEQKDALARIVLPRTYAWPDWVKPLVNGLGLRVNWAATPFEVIAEAYEAAFKARTGINRDVKNFKMPEGDTSAAEKLAEFSAAAAHLRADLDATRELKFKEEAEYKMESALLRAAQDRLQASTSRLSREQLEYERLDGQLLSAAKVKELEKMAKNAGKVAQADAEVSRLQAEIVENKATLSAINDLSARPACPTCSSPITPEMVQSLAGPLVARANALSEQVRSAIEARKALSNPAEAAAQLSLHAEAVMARTRATERIREEQAAIRDAEAAVATYEGRRAPDATALNGDIGSLEARLEVANTDVQRARDAKSLAARVEAAKAELNRMTKVQCDLNRLVDYFGDEVRTELLGASVAPFLDRMNDVLAAWGYRADLRMEPYAFAVIFQHGDDGREAAIELKHLSRSQRYRFGVAFQAALAVVSGYGFVVVDESDLLDADGREGLYEVLLSLDLDQVIVLGTDERETVPEVKGAAFYQFTDAAEPGMVPATQVRQLIPDVQEAA